MNLQESIRNDLNKIDEEPNNLPSGWKIEGAYALYVDAKTGLTIDMAVGGATYEFDQARDFRAKGIVPKLEVVSKTQIEEDEVRAILNPFFASFGEVKLIDVNLYSMRKDLHGRNITFDGDVEFASKRSNTDDINRMISAFSNKLS
jgi:hypothetical protein